MRCCDCEFRRSCNKKENDLTCFNLCVKRINHLFDIELKDKLNRIEQIDRLKAFYGFEFPIKATYCRSPDRIYTIMDFADGEEIEFYGMCGKPSSIALGYADYISKDKGIRLTNICELKSK